MKEKLTSILFLIASLALVALGAISQQGVDTFGEVDWGNVGLWVTLAGGTVAWLGKDPWTAQQADKARKNGGRLPK